MKPDFYFHHRLTPCQLKAKNTVLKKAVLETKSGSLDESVSPSDAVRFISVYAITLINAQDHVRALEARLQEAEQARQQLESQNAEARRNSPSYSP